MVAGSYAIFYISQPLGHRKVPGYHMFPAVNYFPDLSHINIQQGVKTHTVGIHPTTPVLKHVHVNYEKLRTKYLDIYKKKSIYP